MNEPTRHVRLPLAAALLRAYLRTRLRGRTRLTAFLAQRLKSLRAVPIEIDGLPPVYMNLRLGDTRLWLKGSPWESSPREIGEQGAMRRVVRRGDVVFDIGANVGLHTVLLSSLAGPEGRAFAFEPNRELHPALVRTVAGLGNTVLLHYALSDRTETSALFVPLDHSMASLSDWTKGKFEVEAHEVTCELRRMDDLVAPGELPAPDFIKCDVEGAELTVFQGGRDTLDREDAPFILFEANVHAARGFGLDISAARDFLEDLPRARYQFLEVGQAGELSPLEALNPVHSNLLAVPRAATGRVG
ncbi:MAG: FkbM family methyltransferase [Acidobacteria bacterium]|nr:FkbM family methyltransferase [Acidobacteriota bacterium]